MANYVCMASVCGIIKLSILSNNKNLKISQSITRMKFLKAEKIFRFITKKL